MTKCEVCGRYGNHTIKARHQDITVCPTCFSRLRRPTKSEYNTRDLIERMHDLYGEDA